MSINLFSIQSLLCCLAFFFAGIIDSVCGGGGLITIPMMLAVGIPVHFITGTNQCSAWIGTGVAAFDYLKSGNIHIKSALITLPFSMLGSFLGAKMNLMMPEQYLKLFMVASIPVISFFIFTDKKLGETDSVEEKSNLSIMIWSAAIGFFLGGYQGFYGPVCCFRNGNLETGVCCHGLQYSRLPSGCHDRHQKWGESNPSDDVFCDYSVVCKTHYGNTMMVDWFCLFYEGESCDVP